MRISDFMQSVDQVAKMFSRQKPRHPLTYRGHRRLVAKWKYRAAKLRAREMRRAAR